MKNDKEKVSEYLPHLDSNICGALEKYYDILLKFNSKINLVSETTINSSGKHHFVDSVLGCEIISKKLTGMNSHNIYDLGSGNGFPGIIFALLNPDFNIVLVEKDQRKSEFMKHVSSELLLKNISVFSDNLSNLPNQTIHIATTRAMASLSKLLIQCSNLCDLGAVMYHFKGDSWTTELANCPTQIFNKWDINEAGKYTLPDSSIERYVIETKVIG